MSVGRTQMLSMARHFADRATGRSMLLIPVALEEGDYDARCMFVFLSKLIDWSIFQGVALTMPPGHGKNPRLEQALQLLNRPDFISPESRPVRLEFENCK